MNNITSIVSKPACAPGTHASPDVISSEYDEYVVKKQLQLLKESEKWSRKELEKYQFERLKKLLIHAESNVPYYRKIFKDIGFRACSFNSLDEMKHIPMLSKETIIENIELFIDERADINSLVYMSTGGSTGNPLKVIMSREFRSKNHANTHYYMENLGFKVGGYRSVRLHGNRIPNTILSKGKYWVGEGNRLTMSVYHIGVETCESYIDAINSFKPIYIHAYPSAISLLCQYIKAKNLKLTDSVKTIFCDSETLYLWQRQLIEETTKAEIINTYGHTEGAIAAVTFPNSRNMEVLEQIGLMEIINKKNEPVYKAGESGEIVVTGFNNFDFPLIRYRTRDIASMAADQSTGRPYIVLDNIQGRIQDYVVTIDGNLVPIAPLLFDYNFDWKDIKEFQVYQDVVGEIEFRIVKNKDSDESDSEITKRIISEFNVLLSGQLDITASIIDDIKRTARGKYRYIEQCLDIGKYLT